MSHSIFFYRRFLHLLIIAFWVFMGISAAAQELPSTPGQALAYEKQDRIRPNSFYQPPVPLQVQPPGTLIRSQPSDDYQIPAGTRAVRILYHSRSAGGRDLAASAVMLMPDGRPPAGGWPVIAWAHGTSGVAQMCAPSLMKDLYYGDEGLFPMVSAGFAVVATDYAGLGTPGPHEYLDRIAQANDVINSVTAARRAVPDLSDKWVVDGHSQGGGAAWGVAEQEADLNDPGYLGAVVVAGTINPDWFMEFNSTSREEWFYTVYAAYAVKARFPKFQVKDMLTPPALALYQKLTHDGCWYYGEATAKTTAMGKVARPDWMKNPWVHKFIAENETLKRPVSGPLFVIAGGADRSIPADSVRAVVDQACNKGYEIEFRVYPGLDHDPLMDKSTPDQLEWIRNRFAGKPAPGNCSAPSP